MVLKIQGIMILSGLLYSKYFMESTIWSRQVSEIYNVILIFTTKFQLVQEKLRVIALILHLRDT